MAHPNWTHYRKTGPTALPVTIRQVKQALRIAIEDDSHDEDIGRKIQAATEKFEAETDRPCIDQTFIHLLPGLADEMRLYKAPAHSVVSITYIDDEGSDQTLDPATYSISPGDNTVYRTLGSEWPSFQTVKNSIRIEYIAGNTSDPANVPGEFKEAVIAQVAAWWEDPMVGQRYQEAYDRIKNQIAAAQVWG